MTAQPTCPKCLKPTEADTRDGSNLCWCPIEDEPTPFCQTCDKPKCEFWDRTDAHGDHLCLEGADDVCHATHPPREGREDGERCDGSGRYRKYPDASKSGLWTEHDCEGCDNCRKPDAAKCCDTCGGNIGGEFAGCICGPAHGATKGEELADQCHEQWRNWMRHIFLSGKKNLDGSFTISPEFVERWERQADTAYANLSEKEKDSDRRQAAKFGAILSRSEKVGEARAWGKAVEAAMGRLPLIHECNDDCFEDCTDTDASEAAYDGVMSAVNAIKSAAKDDGHQVG